MKITFVLPGVGLGGGARVVFEYANRLMDRGHEVSVLYPQTSLFLKRDPNLKAMISDIGALKNYYKPNRVDWFDLKAKLIRVPCLRPRWVRLMEWAVPDADVVIATSKETAEPVSLLSARKGIKFYFIQHYEAWDLWDNERCWEEAERLANDKCQLSLAMVDIVPRDERLKEYKALVDRTYLLKLKKITISTWLKRMLEEKFGEKVESTIINGINFDIFFREPSPERTRVRILMPYRPYRNKGTEDGIRALEIIREHFPDTEFVMYGDNRGKDLPGWIHFHGHVSDDVLRHLYSTSDIFVSPSWTEGCQLPPMEAMACGCAVAATCVGGVPDYTIDGETALVSPPRDPEALARNLLRLVSDEGERKRIAENGHRHVQRYSWDKATDDFENTLKKYAPKK